MSSEQTEAQVGGLEQEIIKVAEGIADYAASYIRTGKPMGRVYYGHLFIAELLQQTGRMTEDLLSTIWSIHDDLDCMSNEYHWEFNVYQMSRLVELGVSGARLRQATTSRFTGNSVTNWTLLRYLAQFRTGLLSERQVLKSTQALLSARQHESGCILDSSTVASQQYHHFSTSLLAEMSWSSNLLKGQLAEALQRAVYFQLCTTLPNGQCEFLGRGQEQTFGIGPLLYSCATTLRLFAGREAETLEISNRVLTRLLEFRRPDGSFPLVMRKGEASPPISYDTGSESVLGWYAYNNYFDYLGVLGAYLVRTAHVLQQVPERRRLWNPQRSDAPSRLLIKIELGDEHSALVARPFGAWSNAIPLPFVYNKHKVLTSTFGGEQFGSELYSPRCMPVPYHPEWGVSFSKWSIFRWFWGGRWLVGVGPWGLFLRKISYGYREICILDTYVGLFGFRNWHLYSSSRCHVSTDGEEVSGCSSDTCVNIVVPRGAKVLTKASYNYEEPLTGVLMGRVARVRWRF